MFSLTDYRFHLPEDRIAETAVHPAHNAKMMVIQRDTWALLSECNFWHLDEWLSKDAVLFFNNSRVLRARIPLKNQPYTTSTGEEKILSEGELFFLKECSATTFEALVRPGKKFKIDTTFHIAHFCIKVISLTSSGRILEITGGSIAECMEQYGKLPLPPYIEYSREKEDDYQSIFAEKNGSVAAPTASLHFTKELIQKLPNAQEFVTLHIGLGTFKTIDTDDIRSYEIHSESVEVPRDIFDTIFDIKHFGRLITAVGTTACRTLESLPSLWRSLDEHTKATYSDVVRHFWDTLSIHAVTDWIEMPIIRENSIHFSTRAYITPGYTFRVIDELITNFHLPESSLLVLVAALIGQKCLMHHYQHAIDANYRFFSFGDGMYIRAT